MNYDSGSEEEESQKGPEDYDEWAIDPATYPLVNVITFGWTEDGRCGYDCSPSKPMQTCPRPVESLRILPPAASRIQRNPDLPIPVEPRYVCKNVAAGSRHSLFLMIDTIPKDPEAEKSVEKPPLRSLKVMMTGLNQVALCEEKGYEAPIDINIEHDYAEDRPLDIVAGRGCSFVLTDRGALYSFGHGNHGVLGHENIDNVHTPTRVRALLTRTVIKVSTGFAHCLALTDCDEVFSWGRNDKGQLGVGSECKYEVKLSQVVMGPLAKYKITDVSCGHSHSIALVTAKNRLGVDEASVYCWGDESRGQLGSGDAVYRARPQQNQWLTKLLNINKVTIESIHAGGYHNLVLLKHSGQVVSWGACEYGQLGTGFLWDDPQPKIINNLTGVIHISAGLRHNAAVCDNNSIEVFTWGYNGSGELGLGDTDVRLQPTHVSAIKNTKVLGVSCGDRHTIVITSPSPITVKDDTHYAPYFKILDTAEGAAKGLKKRIKHTMKKQGLNPDLLDVPDEILPDQIGSNDAELKNDAYAKGLQYCLDTHIDPFDWRRKALETCFEANTKTMHLKAVCLSCARNCLFASKLRPYIRNRTKGDHCDCRLSGNCMCSWSHIRAEFDKIIDEDRCIAPRQVRGLLKVLRAPYQVEGIDVEDSLMTLAEGREDEDVPRIAAVPFEKWYRKYFDEAEEDPLSEKKETTGTFSRSDTARSDLTTA